MDARRTNSRRRDWWSALLERSGEAHAFRPDAVTLLDERLRERAIASGRYSPHRPDSCRP